MNPRPPAVVVRLDQQHARVVLAEGQIADLRGPGVDAELSGPWPWCPSTPQGDRPPPITLVGAGALGRRVADCLVALGPRSLTLVDDTLPDPTVYPGTLRATSSAALAEILPASDCPVRTRSTSELLRAGDGIVVVATDAVEPDRSMCDSLTRLGSIQLFVRVHAGVATLGPLVVPGRTACLRCYDHVRTGTDPWWPHTLLDLMHRRPAADPVAMDWAAANCATELGWFCHWGESGLVDGMMQMSRSTPGVLSCELSAHPDCRCRWTTPAAA